MTTPARRQYLNIKEQHADAILLFRMGDFYETFDDDARTVSQELDIALTAKSMGHNQKVPLAGVPYHSLDSYLPKLIQKGYKVAICEQVSDPATSKGIVDREVVRIVTPGTVIEDSLLEHKSNNYLAAAYLDGDTTGIAYIDITTSEFATSQFPTDYLSVELTRLQPAELLISSTQPPPVLVSPTAITVVDPDMFHLQWSHDALLDHFGVTTLESYGCEDLPLATRSSGAILEYIRHTRKEALRQITSLSTYSTSAYMVLDHQTRRNLELFESGRWGEIKRSLYSVLDKTRTPMGGRLLKRWLGQPLLNLEELQDRQDMVTWFHGHDIYRERIRTRLKSVSDMERLLSKVIGSNALPRDLLALATSLESAPYIKDILVDNEDHLLVEPLTNTLRNNKTSIDLIRKAILEEPSPVVGNGKTIKPGFSTELDSIRDSSTKAQNQIANLESRERERTNIKSLKVGYNKVFGYYIEVSRANLQLVPDEYIRRQTLVGGERYITPEIKEYETHILNAQDQIAEIEKRIFRQVCQQISDQVSSIMITADAISKTDVFCSLAEIASRNNYCKPELNETDTIEIKGGRHPVIEQMLLQGDFVPNDTYLSCSDTQLSLITGPNMAGKSTYIRQVAIITLLAQIGSFIPAEKATIGLVDRIFSRIGLQDDLAIGQSTFMVEMIETAAILNHATHQSLIILDEIGRGTSTYDGLAIAKAVAEYIHNHPKLGCKTLFATHYHELTQLANILPRIRNLNVAVSDENGSIVFLRRIMPGSADRSYGVHVAQLAGLPNSVVNRSREILCELEASNVSPHEISGINRQQLCQPKQLPLLKMSSSIPNKLLEIDVSSMTPLEAINKLYELQQLSEEQP